MESLAPGPSAREWQTWVGVPLLLLLGGYCFLVAWASPLQALCLLVSRGAPEGRGACGCSLIPGCPQHTSGCTGRLETATCSGISPGPCTPWPWSPSPAASHRASRPSQEVSPAGRCSPRGSHPQAAGGWRQEAVPLLHSRRSQAQRSRVTCPESHSTKTRSRLLGRWWLWPLSESSGW